ncbi:MAG: hypothetical protein EOO70_02675 [Myxococcaceae bacterium]|nr:MAG: hypothetical protein EOO70_02675 [Myxococcaceae bacterium]
MASTKAKPAAPKPRARDHEREEQGRATSVQKLMKLTPNEAARIDGLAARLGAPMKQAILAAVDAATIALDDKATMLEVRAPLRADLSPAKPGPKPADPEG